MEEKPKKKKDNILSRMDECPNSYAKKKSQMQKAMCYRDFPGGPAVRTLCFQRRVSGLIPGGRTKDPTCGPKKGKKKKEKKKKSSRKKKAMQRKRPEAACTPSSNTSFYNYQAQGFRNWHL